MTPLTPDERSVLLESIERINDKLAKVAAHYDRMRVLASGFPSDAFLTLTESAGRLASDRLSELATVLELMEEAGRHEHEPKCRIRGCRNWLRGTVG